MGFGKTSIISGSLLIAILGAAGSASAQTADTVRQRGELLCGVAPGLPGFAAPDSAGAWSGLDVDLCRAIATMVLGDDTKVQYKPLSYAERFTALQSGEVDVMVEVTTWTATRDISMGLDFPGINFYDGQGFMVRRDANVASVNELDGATICVDKGTTNELNLADYFRANGLTYTSLVFDKADETIKTYESGRCDAYTIGMTGLASARVQLAAPDDHVILSDVISKEPLGPVVRQDDPAWKDLVGWALFTMIAAEEVGVTSVNVDEMLADPATPPEVRRMLGAEGDVGEAFGVANDFGYQIIKRIGNYGESFARNVGEDSPLKLPRGPNQPWTQGGLLYVPPFR
jgi:general L-amino acid transport system substrate-binding protein